MSGSAADISSALPAPGATDAVNALIGAIPTRRLFGIPVLAATMDQVMAICAAAVGGERKLILGVVNAGKIVNMQRQALLRDSVMSADIVLADGMAVVWASRVLRQPLPERVAGIDIFENLLALADRDRRRVFFLGAKQDVLDELVRRVHDKFPNAIVAGSRNGYFADADAECIADEINAQQPDLLFLGMSTPKKEIFLASQGPRISARICHGVGGSFDVFAGKVRRAPALWQKLGLEWFYRFLQEPRRMWRRYLVTNTLFVGMTLRAMLRRS